MLSFKPPFSLSSFTFIKSLFSSSLSAMRVVSSAYLRLLLFLLAILTPACASFKINVDSDCSHEFKRCLVLGRKAVTNLNSELKSRDITLPTKVCIVKAMVYLVIMDECASQTVKKPVSSVQYSHSVVYDSL